MTSAWEGLDLVERVFHEQRIRFHYGRHERHLVSPDASRIPDGFLAPFWAHIAEVGRLIYKHGRRVGYKQVRLTPGGSALWHTVVVRTGEPETACRIHVRNEAINRDLPPDGVWCRRCIAAHIRRELERVSSLPINARRSA